MRTRILIALFVVVAFVGTSVAAEAAKTVNVKGGFSWHPLQRPISYSKAKSNWQKLTKGAPEWKLYMVKSMHYAGRGAMTILLEDDTGLDVQTTLTQPQWLGFTSACVETSRGVVVGAHEVSGDILAFAAPVKVK